MSVEGSPFVRLLRTSARYRRTCMRATIFSVLNKVFDIAPEVLIGVAVDVVVQRHESFLAKLGLIDPVHQLMALAALTLFIWAMESLFEYLYMLDWRGLAQTVQHELRLEAYEHLQKLDVAYFENTSAGGLTAILNDDINQLERFLDGGANSLIQVTTAVILIGAIFFYLAPLVALWAMAPIPFILYGAFRYQRLAEPLYAGVRAKAAALAGKISSNITGITTIKSQTAEEVEHANVRAESLSYVEANARAIKVSSAFIPLIRMAILAGFVATLILGGRMAINGEIAVGSYGVLVFLTQRLLWPLTGLAQTVDLYQRAMASTKRVLDLLATPIATARPGGITLPRKSVKGELAFESVSFAYPGREPLINGLSLTLPTGSTTALVGATGAGKSTVAKLLLRFYEPTSGRILLDGRDITELDVKDLRRAIGFVSQDIFLFDGSVAENIAYGVNASSEAIEQAAKVADAHEFIARLPQGYGAMIGERGVRLSGGQRQRLAIARAVLRDPPIMVLDEATSAVDNESERLIQKALARIAVGRTMLIIAHRLSTVRHADMICVFDRGTIVERGTHEELVRHEAQYAWLWKVQTGAHLRDER